MAIDNPNIPSRTQDIVAILNQDTFEQVFREARPIKISSNSTVQYMQNPIETGGVITDHSITLPDVVSVTCVITNFNYRALVPLVREASRSGTRFVVQSKSQTYTNMVIEELPIEEDPDKFDSVVISLNFREVQFDTAQIQTLSAEQVSNPADQSTVDRGEQSTTQTEGSLAVQAANAIGAVS